MEPILQEIKEERQAQDKQWGGPKHDDSHAPNDWLATIMKHAGKAVEADVVVFRQQMIRVAALAVAAVERVDRFTARG